MHVTETDISGRASLDRNIAQALPIICHEIVLSNETRPVPHGTVSILTAFLGKIRLLADGKEMSGLLQESLDSSLPQLLRKFETLKLYGDELMQLSMEVVSTIRSLPDALLGNREILAKLYLPLEYTITASGHNADPAQKRLVDDFLLNHFNHPASLAFTVESHPRLVNYILSSLGDTPSSNRAAWLAVISRNQRSWFQETTWDIWLKLGFARQIVSFLQDFTDPSTIGQAALIMVYLSKGSRVWNKGFLDNGAVDAVLGASARFDREPLTTFQTTLLELLLLLWDSPNETPDINWASNSLFLALKQLLLCAWDDPGPVQVQLHMFIGSLAKRRSAAAFITHQLDVAINRIYSTQYRWNYILYRDVRPSASCGRPMYIQDNLL